MENVACMLEERPQKMTESDVRAMASRFQRDLVMGETEEARIGSRKVENVHGDVDAQKTTRLTARDLEQTSARVLDDEDGDFEDENGLGPHMVNGERSLQVREDNRVFGTPVPTRNGGADAQTAMVKKMTPDPRAKLLDEAKEDVAQDVDG